VPAAPQRRALDEPHVVISDALVKPTARADSAEQSAIADAKLSPARAARAPGLFDDAN